MKNREATEKFKAADRLYRERRYEDALVILDELTVAFPDDRHVMFPRARCLAKLDRATEAMYLLRAILDKEDYEPAAELLNYLSVLQTTPMGGEEASEPSHDQPEFTAPLQRQPKPKPKPAAARGIAPMPIPGSPAKPARGVMDSLDALDASMPGVDGGDAGAELGLLDQMHGGRADSQFDLAGAAARLDDDLDAPVAKPLPEKKDTGRDIPWVMIGVVSVIVIAVLGLGVLGAMTYEPPTPEEIAAQEAAEQEAAEQAAAERTQVAEAEPEPEEVEPFPGAWSGEFIFPDDSWTSPQVLAWEETIWDETMPEEYMEQYWNHIDNMSEQELAKHDAKLDRAYAWGEEYGYWEDDDPVTAGDVGQGIAAFIFVIILNILAWVFLCLLWQPLPIYLTLMIGEKMPTDELGSNIIQIVYCCLILGLLTGVFRLGYFIGVAAIGNQFDWGFVDYLMYIFFSAAMGAFWVALIVSLIMPGFIENYVL